MTDRERLGTMDDLTAELSAEDRVRIDASKVQMLDAAERGHELSSLPLSRA